MKKGKGKSKGNQFEILISKDISRWLTNNDRDDLFWRSSNSGGRQTVRYKQGIDTHNQAGDITVTHPDGELFISIFCLECKHYAKAGIWSIITKTRGNTIIGWWETHIKKSKEVNKYPILIVRQNNRPILFICNTFISEYISKFCFLKPKMKVELDTGEISIFLFDDILNSKSENFQTIIKILNRNKNEANRR